MTLHARGYRRHEEGFGARGPRFLPILADGYKEAIRGKAFRRLTGIFLLLLMVHAVILYVVPDWLLRRAGAGGGASDLLRSTVASYVLNCSLLVPLLALFVGSGLVAEDLRTRALPLYLVRPITAADYWLGKLLIPAAVIATAYVVPLLLLVTFGILLRPSAQVLSFALEQPRLVAAILAHGLAAGIVYGSLVLLASTVAARRIPALILGAAVVYGGEAARIATVASGLEGADLLRAVALPSDLRLLFHAVSGEALLRERWQPDPEAAFAVLAAIVALGAWAVLRRARTTEVVS